MSIISIRSFVPTVPTFAVRETQSLGQQMLNAPLGINGLRGEASDPQTVDSEKNSGKKNERHFRFLRLKRNAIVLAISRLF